MSLLTQMVLIEKYGLRVDLDRLAEILETTSPNIRRKISDNSFLIPTYIDGGKRWADIRDVADYGVDFPVEIPTPYQFCIDAVSASADI